MKIINKWQDRLESDSLLWSGNHDKSYAWTGGIIGMSKALIVNNINFSLYYLWFAYFPRNFINSPEDL